MRGGRTGDWRSSRDFRLGIDSGPILRCRRMVRFQEGEGEESQCLKSAWLEPKLTLCTLLDSEMQNNNHCYGGHFKNVLGMGFRKYNTECHGVERSNLTSTK